jgi:hypothetical protein
MVRPPSALLWGFWLCALIALAAVARRIVALIRPFKGGPQQIAQLDTAFPSHSVPTAAHIIPAVIFVVLAALLAARHYLDKWIARLQFPFGAITGLTAYAMSAFAVGGWIERSAVLFFNTYFLLSRGVVIGFDCRWCRHGSVNG